MTISSREHGAISTASAGAVTTRAPATWSAYGRTLALLFAAGWFATGLLYAYVSVITPVILDPAVTTSPQQLAAYFRAIERGAPLYLLTFVCFTAADFLLLLLSVVLRELVEPRDVRIELARTCMVVAMSFGVLVDVMLFSHWLVTLNVAPSLGPSAQAALWVVWFEIQTLGVWLSVAGFLIGALGLLLFANAIVSVAAWRRWAVMTRAFAGVMLLEVGAIVFDTVTASSGLATGVLFLLLSVVVAPTWALWLARGLRHVEA